MSWSSHLWHFLIWRMSFAQERMHIYMIKRRKRSMPISTPTTWHSWAQDLEEARAAVWPPEVLTASWFPFALGQRHRAHDLGSPSLGVPHTTFIACSRTLACFLSCLPDWTTSGSSMCGGVEFTSVFIIPSPVKEEGFWAGFPLCHHLSQSHFLFLFCQWRITLGQNHRHK